MGKCSAHRNIPLSPRCARTLPFGRAGRPGPGGARRRADVTEAGSAPRSLSRKHNSWYEVFELFRSPPIQVGWARALEPISEGQEFGNLPFGLDLVQPVAITFEPRRFGGRGA